MHRTNEMIYRFYFKHTVSKCMRMAGKIMVMVKKRGRGRPPKVHGPTSRSNTPSSLVNTPSNSIAKKRRPPAKHQVLPLKTVRSDNLNHFPNWTTNRQLCQNCSKFRSFTKCKKCKVYLCYNEKRNCFLDFHKV